MSYPSPVSLLLHCCLSFSDGEDFEELDVEAYSSPPDLPDVMKEHQDPLGAGHEGM